MADEGVSVVTPAQATASGRADVDVGLLNLMPDTALRATDRQFVRLLSAAARDIDVWVYPFTVAEEHRGAEARQHIASHYLDFGDVKGRGLDALVVTGANPTQHDLEQEHFWDGLSDVLDWATVSTRSVLCSCLATHAVLHKYLGKTRTRLPRKRWGVYSHRVLADHPLLAGIGGPVEAPHSHWYDVTREEMEAVGLTVILESDEAGVHMAVDDQDFYVFFQGHPEYDLVSLLKEYRRELGRYYRGERADYPPVPEHYFDAQALARIEEYRPVLEAAKAAGLQPPGLPEERLLPRESHTWSRDGQVIFSNWLHRIVGESPG
jgi:homoserine O-succinyltransferase